jgi:uncharacterized protein Yka (UPF0111/DUF47 family)
MVLKTEEFEEALAAKTQFTRSQDRVMEEAKEKLALHHDEINELTRRIIALEQERDDMARLVYSHTMSRHRPYYSSVTY